MPLRKDVTVSERRAKDRNLKFSHVTHKSCSTFQFFGYVYHLPREGSRNSSVSGDASFSFNNQFHKKSMLISIIKWPYSRSSGKIHHKQNSRILCFQYLYQRTDRFYCISLFHSQFYLELWFNIRIVTENCQLSNAQLRLDWIKTQSYNIPLKQLPREANRGIVSYNTRLTIHRVYIRRTNISLDSDRCPHLTLKNNSGLWKTKQKVSGFFNAGRVSEIVSEIL